MRNLRKTAPFIALLFVVGIVAANGCAPVATPPPTATPVPTPDIAAIAKAAAATAVASQPTSDATATYAAIATEIAVTQATQPEHATPSPAPTLVIHDDALDPGWEDWSWDCQRNFKSTALVHEGQYAIAVDYAEKGWGGLAFGRHDPISTKGYNRLEFWIHGGASGGQVLRVSFNTCPSDCELPPGGMSINNSKYIEGGVVSPNTWKLVSIPLADLGAVDVSIVKLNIMDNSGGAQPTFYVDDVVLVKK